MLFLGYMKKTVKQIIQLYTQYIKGLKRLSAKERNEISRVLLKYKKVKEKTYEKSI